MITTHRLEVTGAPLRRPRSHAGLHVGPLHRPPRRPYGAVGGAPSQRPFQMACAAAHPTRTAGGLRANSILSRTVVRIAASKGPVERTARHMAASDAAWPLRQDNPWTDLLSVTPAELPTSLLSMSRRPPEPLALRQNPPRKRTTRDRRQNSPLP